MDYSQAIDYLHGLTDYEKTRIERYTPETLDLSRMERLLAEVGDPHTHFPALHIAGTKGKGSTAAMCESCFRAAGYRTGLYTSPHLHTFRERIQIAGEKISPDEVVALVEELRPIIERAPGVTTFEAITAMGFLHFAHAGIDIAVIEVGLGGRLDATNVLTPEVSIITSLSLDHTYLLGDTLGEIAFEKAGIIKPGAPVVSAPQRAEAIKVIESVSKKRGATLIEVGRDWDYQAGTFDLEGQTFSARKISDDDSPLDGKYRLPLLGRHQLENAVSALAALDVLRQRGFDLSAGAVREGLAQVTWPGRMEILCQDPPFVVDCAHNPYSAQVLRQALTDWFPGRQWVLIFGASADKDIGGMLESLLPISEYVIVTRSDHPRSASPIKLADVVASLGGGAEVCVSVAKAIRRGLTMMDPGSGLLATGSIFLVADAVKEWARRNGLQLPDDDQDERKT